MAWVACIDGKHNRNEWIVVASTLVASAGGSNNSPEAEHLRSTCAGDENLQLAQKKCFSGISSYKIVLLVSKAHLILVLAFY